MGSVWLVWSRRVCMCVRVCELKVWCGDVCLRLCVCWFVVAWWSKMSAVGFEPTSTNTLRPERNPLDHSGKLTRSFRHLSTPLQHTTIKTPQRHQTNTTNTHDSHIATQHTQHIHNTPYTHNNTRCLRYTQQQTIYTQTLRTRAPF